MVNEGTSRCTDHSIAALMADSSARLLSSVTPTPLGRTLKTAHDPAAVPGPGLTARVITAAPSLTAPSLLQATLPSV